MPLLQRQININVMFSYVFAFKNYLRILYMDAMSIALAYFHTHSFPNSLLLHYHIFFPNLYTIYVHIYEYMYIHACKLCVHTYTYIVSMYIHMYLYLSLRFSMFCIHYLFALLLNMHSFLIHYNLNKVSPPLLLPTYPNLFYPHPLFFCFSLEKNGHLGENNKTQQK